MWENLRTFDLYVVLWKLRSKGIDAVGGKHRFAIIFLVRILFGFPDVYGSRRDLRHADAASMTMERTMKRTLIRYKAKPDAADRNAALIEKVFEELKATKPDGLRYLSLRLDDDTFVHLVESEEGATPLPSLEAFKAFQSEIRERCIEPPVPSGATIVGNYRMLSES
jgi:hypothetical protein